MSPVDEREVFDSGPVVLFKWRNAAGWPVDYASRNVQDVLGYSRDDFLQGRVAYSQLIHAADLGRVTHEVQRACEGDAKDFTHEPYRVCRADGRVIWLYDHTHLVRDEAGAITHFHGYVIDCTSHVAAQEKNFQLEQQLLHAQKLESLGVLAGGLAHDFNNVLTGIMGHTSVARQELSSEHALRVPLARIDALAQQAADLCAQLLAYSGRGQFVVHPLDLRRVVRDVKGMLRVAVSKKATFELDIPEALPPVLGDRAQLQQIVMNLVGNASDALGQGGGTIRLSLAADELDGGDALFPGTGELEPGRYVRLTVADTGCGMSPEAQERLFDPFFTTKVTGRGLGLAAVLGILRGHGGGIRLKSREGAGSRFDLFFPVCEGEVEDEPETAEDSDLSEVPSGVALLVDDEPVVRRTGRLLLTSLGFDVELAVDGLEAVEKVRAHGERYAFVLLDMTMPKLGGRETLRELRALEPRLPVILSSGFSRDEAIQSEDDRGALEFLQKPYRVEQLAATIQRLFANARVD
ncbi:MAG: response regulator [Planctomycetota bacterium]